MHSGLKQPFPVPTVVNFVHALYWWRVVEWGMGHWVTEPTKVTKWRVEMGWLMMINECPMSGNDDDA